MVYLYYIVEMVCCMRLLYHFPLCPFSRKVRILLAEKHLDFKTRSIKFWDNNTELYELTGTGQVPVLIDNSYVISDSNAIAEYLEEVYDIYNFMGKTPVERAEVRRLVGWFDHSFYYSVTRAILNERVIKYYSNAESPNSSLIRATKSSIAHHVGYIAGMLDKYQWVAGNFFSLADIVVASHLSVLDYLNDISWQNHVVVREWYSLVKARPSFQPILQDRVVGFRPPAHYAKIDF